LEGSLLRPIELRVSTDLDLEPAGTPGPPVHGQIAASYQALGRILDLGRSSITLPSSRAVFSGAIGRRCAFSLKLAISTICCPHWALSAAKLPVKLASGGEVLFDGTVTGNLDDPRIAGHLRATASHTWQPASTRSAPT